MSGINQQNYYEMSHQIIKDLMGVCEQLNGTGVNIDSMVGIMQKVYVDHILPVELENAQKRN